VNEMPGSTATASPAHPSDVTTDLYLAAHGRAMRKANTLPEREAKRAELG